MQRIPRLSRTRDGENRRRLFISSRSGEESRHFGNSSFFLSDLSACCPFERDKCGTSWHSKIFRATRRKSGINKRLPLLPVPTSQSHPTDRTTDRPAADSSTVQLLLAKRQDERGAHPSRAILLLLPFVLRSHQSNWICRYIHPRACGFFPSFLQR